MSGRHGDLQVRVPPRLVYAAAVIVVSLLATAVGFGVVSSRAEQAASRAEETARRAVAESELRWCGLITGLDDAYRAAPPTTVAGRAVAEAMARMRVEFDCPPPAE